MKAHFLAALLSATYCEVDATAFNFTSDTTATFTNDNGKTFNATFDGVNVLFCCHGASHVENIALNARGLSVCIKAMSDVECYQIIYHTTKDSGVIALKITTENGKFRYTGKYGAGCGLNIDGIKDLIKNNLEWHKKMTLISGVDLLESAPVAPAIVEPVTVLDVAPAIVEPVTVLDVAPALVEPVTIQTNYLGIKTMSNYKNKAQARRFMVQKVTEKIIEMVTAGDFVVPEQTCAATFTGNAVLRDFALVLADDAHNSGFGFSKCQFDLLKPDYMRCMVLDDVFGYWSKTADDLRAKLREIQAQRAAVSDISPALVEPVTVLDVAPALVEPVTVLDVAPAIVITDAVIEVPLASITLSSEVKQFKNNANKTGVVEKLTGKFERAGIKITLRDVASFMKANAGRVLLTVNTQNFGDDLGLNSLKKDDFHAVIYDAPTKTFTSKTGGRFSFDNTNRDFSLSYFSEGGRHGFEFRSNYQTFIIFAAIFEQAAPVVAAPVVVDALQSLRDLSALAIVEPATTVSTPALPCEVSTVAKPLEVAAEVSTPAKPLDDNATVSTGTKPSTTVFEYAMREPEKLLITVEKQAKNYAVMIDGEELTQSATKWRAESIATYLYMHYPRRVISTLVSQGYPNLSEVDKQFFNTVNGVDKITEKMLSIGDNILAYVDTQSTRIRVIGTITAIEKGNFTVVNRTGFASFEVEKYGLNELSEIAYFSNVNTGIVTTTHNHVETVKNSLAENYDSPLQVFGSNGLDFNYYLSKTDKSATEIMEHLHQHWNSMHWFEREESRAKAIIKTIPFLSDGLPCVDLNKEHYLLERHHGLSVKNLHILAENYACLGNFIAAIECYKLASKISTPALPCEVSTVAKVLTVEPVEVVAVEISIDAKPCEVSTVAKPLDDAVTVSMVAKPCNDTPIDQDWDKTHPMARRELASFSGMNADFCMGKSSFDLLPYEKVMLNDGLVRKSKGHFKLKGFAIDEVSTPAKTFDDAATVSTPAMPLTLNGFDIAETIAELNTEYGTNNDVWNADKAEVMALSDTDFNAVLDALEEANYRSKYFILKALRSGTDAVVSGFKALDIEQDKAGELTEDIYQKQRALIAQLKGDSLPPTPPTTPTVSTPAKPLDDNATVSTGTNPCEILVKHGNYDIEYNTQTQSIGITFYPVGGFHLMNDKGDYIRMVKRESGSRIACRFKTLQAAQNVADKLLKKSVTKNYIETCDKPKTTTTQMTSPVDWNKENYDIERKQSMTQHGAMKGKLFAENEAKEFTKLTGKNHTVVIEGSHIFDSKGCFENGKFDGQRFNLYRAVQCDEPPTGNNEHKKPVVKETLTTEKPKFKLQPRTTSLTKMARAGIMVLGWFFARELFNAAGQGKIREFLSQGLKMAWNFDALTVADFARFFAQCTDDTKAAKVYALYCQVMPCPLSLEDLMRLSARLNLNPITAQYRRLSIEETRHAMH